MKISSQKVKTDEILAVCAICNLHSSNNLALKLHEKYQTRVIFSSILLQKL